MYKPIIALLRRSEALYGAHRQTLKSHEQNSRFEARPVVWLRVARECGPRALVRRACQCERRRRARTGELEKPEDQTEEL